MANEEQLRILKEEGVKAWNKWREDNPDVEIDLSEAGLSGAHLIGADLSGAYLIGAHLIGADLSEAGLSGAHFIGADLSGAHLSGADLSCADLSGAHLSGADFSCADLSGADLKKVQALVTNFSTANLTGTCIEDWNINSKTNLKGLICNYIYLKKYQQERRPSDPNRNFEPEEFAKLVQESEKTVDLIFQKGVDWRAFAYSIQNTQVSNEDTPLVIQSIENRGDGVVLIKVNVPQNADKGKIEGDFWQGYEFAKKTLKEQYEARLLDKNKFIDQQDQRINQLFYLLNQGQKILGEVPRLMAEQPKVKVQQNFNAAVNAVAGNVEGNQNVYVSEQKQTLAEAAAEIQQLLDQLSQTYPTNTAREKMVVATEAIERIESDPKLMERILSALKAGGISALEQLLNHPAASFIIAAIEDWQESKEG
ncbi:MAG: pentapeptide repeat-containing protein [Xenococcus sp. (in: cyanobacteria)]